MSKVILQGTDLSISYRSGEMTLQVLKGLDISIHAGEFVSVQGESGSGKTTLLNILAGLELPQSGAICWGETTLQRTGQDYLAKQRARFLGIVFQSYHLVPELNALQNILLALRVARGGVGPAEIARAESLLGLVGLAGRGRQMPNTLSGGECQRVAIARALATQPQLILADEPTGNLDEKTGNAVMSMLQELCSNTGTALVLVTHNPEHAARADRQLYLKSGNFVSEAEHNS